MKFIIGFVACLILAQLTPSSPMPTKEDTADAIVNDATELEEDRGRYYNYGIGMYAHSEFIMTILQFIFL